MTLSKLLAAIAAAIMAILSATSFAQAGNTTPELRAASPHECDVMADLAVLSRASALESVPIVTMAAIAQRVYNLPDARTNEIAAAVIAQAYNASETREPEPFSTALHQVCMRNGGRIAKFFGVRL